MQNITLTVNTSLDELARLMKLAGLGGDSNCDTGTTGAMAMLQPEGSEVEESDNSEGQPSSEEVSTYKKILNDMGINSDSISEYLDQGVTNGITVASWFNSNNPIALANRFGFKTTNRDAANEFMIDVLKAVSNSTESDQGMNEAEYDGTPDWDFSDDRLTRFHKLMLDLGAEDIDILTDQVSFDAGNSLKILKKLGVDDLYSSDPEEAKVVVNQMLRALSKKLSGKAGSFDKPADLDKMIDDLDENANNDYGNNTTSKKGFKYDIDPYAYLGVANMHNRLVGNYGDNPMKDTELRETPDNTVLENTGLPSFRDYLKETERMNSKVAKSKGSKAITYSRSAVQKKLDSGEWIAVTSMPEKNGNSMYIKKGENGSKSKIYIKESDFVSGQDLDEAPGGFGANRQNKYGEPVYLLPAEMNSTLDGLETNQYFGDALKNGSASIVVIGKMNTASGKFTPRYCCTHGAGGYAIGQNVTIVHDQNGGITPGKILYEFSGKDYMQNRDKVAADLERIGIRRTAKVPVKVFK